MNDPHEIGLRFGRILGQFSSQMPDEDMPRNDEALFIRGIVEGVRQVCDVGSNPHADGLVDFFSARLREMWGHRGSISIAELERLAARVAQQDQTVRSPTRDHVIMTAQGVMMGPAPCVCCGNLTHGMDGTVWLEEGAPDSWISHGRLWVCARDACLQMLTQATDFARPER